MSAIEFIWSRRSFDKARMARFGALAMLAGASGFVLAIILT